MTGKIQNYEDAVMAQLDGLSAVVDEMKREPLTAFSPVLQVTVTVRSVASLSLGLLAIADAIRTIRQEV